mmetsp:Transcript_31204/g.100118  ORF Transcript_31204/g.100118 Transcript_31204/m.100118 type:complete len:419 (-) Transcript_31204:22-1278(-)
MAEIPGVETVLECFVTDKIKIDEAAFKVWIRGHTAAEAARYKEAFLKNILTNMNIVDPHDSRINVARRINRQECNEQFQLYEWLTPMLNSPPLFQTQSLYTLYPGDVTFMIQEYYSFDETVMRELLGKALSKGDGREVEDNSEMLRVQVRSVRRQFNNTKRIMKHVETEIQAVRASGRLLTKTILEMIQEDFCLPMELASQYLHMIFLCFNKIETFKSRLNLLDFNEWNSLSGVVMAMWGSEKSLELDLHFTDQMRQAKEALLDKETFSDIRKHILSSFKSTIADLDGAWSGGGGGGSIHLGTGTGSHHMQTTRKMMAALESNFNSIMKAIAQIGSGLQEWREVRDLFVDLNDKVLQPLDQADMSLEQVMILFSSMDKALSVSKKKQLPMWAAAWRKCVEAIKMLTVTMYPKLYGRHA